MQDSKPTLPEPDTLATMWEGPQKALLTKRTAPALVGDTTTCVWSAVSGPKPPEKEVNSPLEIRMPQGSADSTTTEALAQQSAPMPTKLPLHEPTALLTNLYPTDMAKTNVFSTYSQSLRAIRNPTPCVCCQAM